MIKQCTCKHPVQDAMHGKDNRVHNQDKKGYDHCTVCGRGPSSERRLKGHAMQWTPAFAGVKK